MTKSQSKYNVVICNGTTLQNRSCRRRTARGQKCWMHTKKELNLRVKDSTVPHGGLGLFTAEKTYKKGEVITPYTGDLLTKKQVDTRYPGNTTGEYVLCQNENKCVDGRKTTEKGLGRWANSTYKTKYKSNAKYTSKFNVTATKTIKPGKEILVNYGRDYWNKSKK